VPSSYYNTDKGVSPKVRIAILSTPRSGNTWLRHLLAKIYDAADLAVHNPVEVDWTNLPGDCVLQLHWRRTAEVECQLKDHGFRVVVMARHPLDVLVSILHFALHDGSTQRWLEGEGGTEEPICGAMPCSAAFLKYAAGPRAAALMAVSRQWWNLPGAIKVHYESLVVDPIKMLARVVESVGWHARMPLAEAIAATTMPKLRTLTRCHHHFWRGQPGHWKHLLPADEANAIAAIHQPVFSELGYVCDPDVNLDHNQADTNWIDLNRQELTDRLWSYVRDKERHELTQAKVAALEQERDQLTAALQSKQADLQRKHADVLAAIDDARRVRKALTTNPTLRLVAALKRAIGVKV